MKIVLYSRHRLNRATSSLLARGDVKLVRPPTLDRLLSKLREAPDVLVIDLELPAPAVTRLVTELGAPALSRTRVVVVTSAADGPELAARAAAFPRSVLVSGGPRFFARLTEAIAEAAGAQHRRHLRRDSPVDAFFTAAAATPARCSIENISESGAKIAVDGPLALGGGGRLRIELQPSLELDAEVVRQAPAHFGRKQHYGIRFVAPTEEQVLALRRIVNDQGRNVVTATPPPLLDESQENVRVAARVRVPTRLRVKARLDEEGGKGGRRLYLDVADVSERGFRAIPSFDAKLEAAKIFQALLLWSHGSFSCSCELARSTAVARDGGLRSEYGFRFVTLPREARAGLARLLQDARARGIRSGRSE